MTSRIVSISVSHKGAPLTVRERLSVVRGDLPRVLHQLRSRCDEVVLLSTCGRLEIYATGTESARLLNEFAAMVDCSGANLHPYAVGRENDASIEHLMRVASGLESPIPGEDHILGQVRSAFLLAGQYKTVGPVLSALFRGAIFCGRRVRNETAISHLAGSYAKLALAAAGSAIARRSKVLIVGSGTLATELATSIEPIIDPPLTIVSRHAKRGMALAKQVGGTWHSLESIGHAILDADVAICCTSSRDPVIRAEHVASGRKCLTILDFGVPRNVDPKLVPAGHRIIDLASITGTRSLTHAVMAEAETIIQQEIRRFGGWLERRARWTTNPREAPQRYTESQKKTRRDQTTVN